MIRFLNKGGTNTADATATADDILSPKTAYVNGEKIEGRIIPTYINENEALVLSADGYIGYTVTNDGLFLIYTLSSGINIINIINGTTKFISYLNMNIPEKSYSSIAVTSANKNNERYVSISTDKVNDTIYYALINFNTFEIKSYSNISLGLSQGRYAWKTLGNTTKNNNLLYVSGLCNNQNSFVSIVNLKKGTYANRINGEWFSNIMIDINDNFVLVNFTQDIFWIDEEGNIFDDTGTSFKNYILNTENNLAWNTSDGNVYKYTEDFDLKKLTLGELLFNIKNLWGLPTSLSSSVRNESAFLKDNIIFIQGYGLYKNGKKLEINIDKNGILNKNICKGNIELVEYSSNSLSIHMSSGYNKLVSLLKGSQTYYDTSDTTAVSNDILIEKTAYINGKKQIGTMPNNGELNYTPSGEKQTIPAGYTDGGKISAINYNDTLSPTEYIETLEKTSAILNNTSVDDILQQLSITVVDTWNEGSKVSSISVKKDKYYVLTLTSDNTNLSNINITGVEILNDVLWNNYWSSNSKNIYVKTLIVKTNDTNMSFSESIYPILQELKIGGDK